MTIIAQDILQRGSLSQESERGANITRGFLVEVPAGADPADKDRLAIAECPSLLDWHPTIPGAYCSGHRTESVDPTHIRVLVSYTLPAAPAGQEEPSETVNPQITIGASVTTVQTEKDKDDGEMFVRYYPDPDSTENMQTHIVQAEVMVPCPMFRCQRWEPGSPGPNAVRFVGKLNSTAILGCSAKTLLCTQIEGTSSDGGLTYMVNYEFQYKPDGWQFTAVYIDPDTNRVPANATIGNNENNAVKDYDIYETDDFHYLFPLLP